MSSRSKLAGAIVGTILLAAAVYLVGNHSVALFDRDEPRYAECSREMLKGSPEHPGPNWIVPRFLGELRTAKPPGIYWLQASVMTRLGDTVFAARLPSAIAMVLTLALYAIAIWKLAGPSRAAWATLILASSMMTIVSAKACLTDAVLLLFITTAQLCLYAIYRGRGSWMVVNMLGLSIGCAGLVKGPVVLAVLGTTLIALAVIHVFTRRPRATVMLPVDPEQQLLSTTGKIVLTIAIVVGLVGPWLWAINRAEPSFLPTIIGHDVVNRMKTGLEGHSAPPGYHLLTIWGVYFPWSIFLPVTLIFAWRFRHLPLVRFALATVIGNFIFFECVKTKLPHYLLPIYPWLALLSADAFVRCLRGRYQDLVNGLARNALTVWGGLMVLIGLAPWLLIKTVPVGPVAALSATAVVVGVLVIRFFRARQPKAGLLTLGLGNFAIVSVIFGLFLPHVDVLRTPVLAGAELRRLGLTDAGAVQMLDYKEPSLAFYQGGTIRENSNTILTAQLAADPSVPKWLVITDDVWNKSDPAVQAMYETVKEFPTLAYADSMRRIKVMIIKKK